MSETDNWRNRIIGEGDEDPEQLLANPQNWRIHPKAQQEALEGVLNEVGWVDRVIVNQRTGHLVDGHLRVTLALRRDEPTIPVHYVDLDEAEEAMVLASLDPIAAMAAADRQQLESLLRDVQSGEAGVQAMLADLAEREGVVSGDIDFLPFDGDGDGGGSQVATGDKVRVVLGPKMFDLEDKDHSIYESLSVAGEWELRDAVLGIVEEL